MAQWLIIHPKDETTDFLSECYQDIQDKEVIRDPFFSNGKLRKLLKKYDNIMILGHGTQDGLIASHKGKPYRLMINSNHVFELRRKNTVIGVWCYASEFFKKYSISGFATSMYISELNEAADYMLPLRQSWIEESNNALTDTIRHYYDYPSIDLYAHLRVSFTALRRNAIAMFNADGFKYFNYNK